MPDMSPMREDLLDLVTLTERVRRAADHVEQLSRAVAPGPLTEWNVTTRSVRSVRGDERPAFVVVPHTESPDLVQYLSLWSPVVGVTTAYMLRQVAREIEIRHSYDKMHCQPPNDQRSFEKRVVWAGDQAGNFLRSFT